MNRNQGFPYRSIPHPKNWVKWFDCGPHKLVNHNRPAFIRIWGVITPLCLTFPLLQAKKWVTSRKILVVVRWPPCGAAWKRLVDMKISRMSDFLTTEIYISYNTFLNKPKKIWLFTPQTSEVLTFQCTPQRDAEILPNGSTKGRFFDVYNRM